MTTPLPPDEPEYRLTPLGRVVAAASVVAHKADLMDASAKAKQMLPRGYMMDHRTINNLRDALRVYLRQEEEPCPPSAAGRDGVG